LAGNLATGLVLIALFRKRWENSKNLIGKSLLKSLGLGFVLAVCVPIAALILLVTVIGIPLSILTAVAYLVVFYVAKLIFSTAIFSLLADDRLSDSGHNTLYLGFSGGIRRHCLGQPGVLPPDYSSPQPDFYFRVLKL
jgi:hypothetical protein